MQLIDLDRNASATIVDIRHSELKLALFKLGVTPGAVCTIRDIAPLGDPIAISVNQTKLMLRKKEAAQIVIKPIGH